MVIGHWYKNVYFSKKISVLKTKIIQDILRSEGVEDTLTIFD